MISASVTVQRIDRAIIEWSDLLPGADAAVDLGDNSSTQHLKENHSSSRV